MSDRGGCVVGWPRFQGMRVKMGGLFEQATTLAHA